MINKSDHSVRLPSFLPIIFLGIISIAQLALAQKIIRNPAKPLSQDAGRVLKLREIWRITDEEGQFYLKYPSRFRLAGDGTIFLADEGELLKFSPDGRFQKNLCKKGQGPGELQSFFEFYIKGNEIIAYDFMALKVVFMDLEGNLTNQVNLKTGPYNDFCGMSKSGLVFMKEVFPPPAERKSRLHDVPCAIRLISLDGKSEKGDHAFLRKIFLAPQAATSWSHWDSVLTDDGEILYVSCARDYLIEALHIEKGQVIRRFNRAYARVKYVEKGWEKGFYKKYDLPKIKFEIDVQGLLLNQNQLWVITSRKDEQNGNLIDVFDGKGRFTDSFYLGFKGTLLAALGDFLFALEKDKEENWAIVKYRVIRELIRGH